MKQRMSLNELGNYIVNINRSNGWEVSTPELWPDEPNILGCKLALIHSEISEALEAVRLGDRKNFEEELADTIIRVLDLSSGLGINIEKVVAEKLLYNKTRGYKHGGKSV